MGMSVSTGRGIQLEKAYFHNLDDGSKIPVMFNPAEVGIKKTVPWEEQKKAGKSTGKLQYTAGKARTLTLNLEFDTGGLNAPPSDGPQDALDVRFVTDPLMSLTEVLDEDKHRPPIVSFEWGQGVKFPSIITQFDLTFTKFNPDGIPIRAKATVSLTEVEPSEYGASGSLPESSGSIESADSGSTAANMSGDTAQAQEDNWRDTVDNNPQTFPDGDARAAESGSPTQTS